MGGDTGCGERGSKAAKGCLLTGLGGQGRPWWSRRGGKPKVMQRKILWAEETVRGMEESLEEPWGKPAPAAREGGVGAGLAAGKIQNTR